MYCLISLPWNLLQYPSNQYYLIPEKQTYPSAFCPDFLEKIQSDLITVLQLLE